MMEEWAVANYKDPTLGGIWVYKENPNFPGIHMSQCVDDPKKTHMATNDRMYYYYGVTKTFNGNVPQNIQTNLRNAWEDYYTLK